MTNAGPDPVAAELQRMRESIEGMAASVKQLTEENTRLRERLEASQKARSELMTQAEHILNELGVCRRELARLKADT